MAQFPSRPFSLALGLGIVLTLMEAATSRPANGENAKFRHSPWTEASCPVAPMQAARTEAHARFDKGDVKGAAARLETLVAAWRDRGLPDCLNADPEAAGSPPTTKSFSPEGREDEASTVLDAKLSGHQGMAAEAYAWVLNDLVAYRTDRRFGSTDGMSCYAILAPLFDKTLNPLPWLTERLMRASIANLRACGKTCIEPACVIPRSAVWDRFDSEARSFASHPCPGHKGQSLDAGRCVELLPARSPQPSLEDIRDKEGASLRHYCPSVVLGRQAASEALNLPGDSKLYDPSSCCNEFKITTNPKRRLFMLRGLGQDCFGGTAHFAVEEIYTIDANGRALLVEDNSAGFH